MNQSLKEYGETLLALLTAGVLLLLLYNVLEPLGRIFLFAGSSPWRSL